MDHKGMVGLETRQLIKVLSVIEYEQEYLGVYTGVGLTFAVWIYHTDWHLWARRYRVK